MSSVCGTTVGCHPVCALGFVSSEKQGSLASRSRGHRPVWQCWVQDRVLALLGGWGLSDRSNLPVGRPHPGLLIHYCWHSETLWFFKLPRDVGACSDDLAGMVRHTLGLSFVSILPHILGRETLHRVLRSLAMSQLHFHSEIDKILAASGFCWR